MDTEPHPCWLPEHALAPVGRRAVVVLGTGAVVDTVRAEVDAAVRAHGGVLSEADGSGLPDLVLATVDGARDQPAGGPLAEPLRTAVSRYEEAPLVTEGFLVTRHGDTTVVLAGGGPGLLYGLHHLLRLGHRAFEDGPAEAGGLVTRQEPAQPIRMLDHWDNLAADSPMGPVERGYAGASIFYADGRVRADLSRVARYARLLGSLGINAVGLNNVNVHRREAELLTTHLPDVGRLAAVFRAHGIRVWLSVSYGSPVTLGGLDTADPMDPRVQQWWRDTAERVYSVVGDLGGFVVKADSEGQPGPFAYGRDHADGANLLGRALAPHGGTVFWRAFVYDHRQDWRDRSTDRARAAYDHFAPLDGRFDDNVVVQVKYGPIDFQVREPVSPVIAAMPRTRLAVELQVTQEYTGQQQHVCYLVPQWRELLGFRPWDDDRTVSDVAAGATGPAGGIAAVSNVGDDPFWTGHPLAQANLYGYGRLTWDPTLAAEDVLDEWIGLTFGDDPELRRGLHEIMDGSWLTYERYTSPLGIGFMVKPNHHYGPDIDGYEYSPWGTYHFADRDGIGVDRTVATGTGYAGQYPEPWRSVYESVDTCPDELLLFFHHVPYGHVLHSGTTVVQHIYDTHAAGVEEVERMAARWAELADRLPPDVAERGTGRLAEQLRSAREWRDQVSTYFFRKSGVPDARGRTFY
ncbi:alpha-glucuronidase [Modestobacter sp. VKM Ac-2977]|uniref:alpha-glucuronidase n=1 Tax=Modestobacter sp. VKM Ac-2977 TaxID=3004131 RepID=UPI0022AADBFC|nr:alpha-glucuronidase [Modestobacter sp. VKM Ac-2977]MCZ2822692.1 alpha-glucuronidase [Modestobacter sp. VKM Ac-2977]